MIFTSQSGLTDPTQGDAWDAWYHEHLAAMVSVPGIGSAQRFKAVEAGPPPSLAMYSIAAADVFQSEIYLKTRGMGPWKPLIDPQFYRRNLFEGLERAPDAPTGTLLVVADCEAPSGGDGVSWLRCVGLDRSTPWRGIAVTVDLAAARALAGTLPGRVALYRPVTHRYTAAA